MRTAWARAYGRRQEHVDGAMVELQVAQDAAQAWLDAQVQP
jgi:hypothetical protein